MPASPPHVHEIAQSVNPAARVIYVGYNPIVLTCARALVAGNDRVRLVGGDIRRVEEILSHVDVQNFLD
ncbi:SAM-dependent methyltransferase [Nonomuraea sp. NPDC049400]|uniref:SAM-dependent methyltransferase n=1 Tax=Nonomuraea sp. NPDC049400 TaxID=3364352 RepID=UPI0037A60092